MLGGINETDLALLRAPSSYLPALPRNPLGSQAPLTPSLLRHRAGLCPGPIWIRTRHPRGRQGDLACPTTPYSRPWWLVEVPEALPRSRGRGQLGGVGAGVPRAVPPAEPSRGVGTCGS